MTATSVQLELAVLAARVLVDQQRRDPLRFVRWLPLQHRFRMSRARIKLIRAGNQTIGKSWAALAEVVAHCRGVHDLDPTRPMTPPPVEWWIICSSWTQSVAVQKKLHALLPKDELDPRTSFDPVQGFSPLKSPAVLWLNGSIIRIKTCGQDVIDLASATINGIHFDEPPKSPRLLTEALQRLEELGGIMLLSFTPVNAPVEYLRKLCEEIPDGAERPVIEDHWTLLTPAELIPVGHTEPLRTKDGRPKDAAWIAYRASRIPEDERDVVLHGAWEARLVDSYFGGAFRHAEHVVALDDVPYDALSLGIDHGHRPGKQIAVLVATWREEDGVHAYIVAEYTDDAGNATPRQDAEGILKMLEDQGVDWSDLATANGDRVHMPGRGQQKSNLDLMGQLAKLRRVHLRKLYPQIRTVKRGEGHGGGSVKLGARWLFVALVEGRLHVHPRCKRVIEALQRYRMATNDPQADPIDAVRYALDGPIFAPPVRPGGVEVVVG